MTAISKTKPKNIDPAELLKARTFVGDAWLQFRKHKLAMIAIGVLAVILGGVLIGPLIWTLDPQFIDMSLLGLPPIISSPEHPWGTDTLGRDTLARALQGGRVSLMIGISAMLVSITIGTVVGLLSGFFRRLDNPLMRLTDIFIALPLLPLLLVLMMLFREPLKASFGVEGGVFLLMVSVIGGLQWMPTARLVRGEVLTVKSREFITAATAVGSQDGRILTSHILPNVMSPVIVAATFSIASAIITESALSFLGLGFPPDFPTWGRLLFDGKDYVTITWTLVFWPGMLISLTVLCVNFVGDGLRDALDPRLRKGAWMSIEQSLRDFIDWWRNNIKGDEKSEAQIFLDHLMRAFGHEGALEAGKYETRIRRRRNGKTTVAFADYLVPKRVLIEMKKRGEDLKKHYVQLEEYWKSLPDRPRYALPCATFDEIWIFDFHTQFYDPC